MDMQAAEPHACTAMTEISDEELDNHFQAIVDDRGDRLPPAVALLTNKLLLRCHQKIWQLTREQCQCRSKQRLLARLVGSVCGGNIPSWDGAERPGQRMDRHLDVYCAELKKAHAAVRKAEQRARKKGVEGVDTAAAGGGGSVSNSTRIRDLEDQQFDCIYGCTPAVRPVRSTPPGQLPKRVEFQTCSLAKLNVRLQGDCKQMKENEDVVKDELMRKVAQCERDINSLKKKEERASSAEAKAQARVVVVEDQLTEARAEQRRQSAAFAVSMQDAEDKLNDREANIVKLGSSVARAHFEAGCEAKQSATLKDRLVAQKKEFAEETSQLRAEVEAERARATHVMREAETMRDASAAEVLRMEGLLTRAYFDAANEARQAGKLKEKLDLEQERAAHQLDDLRREIGELRSEVEAERASARRAMREAEAMREASVAEVLRMEGLLTRAHVEAGNEAQQAAKLKGKLQQERCRAITAEMAAEKAEMSRREAESLKRRAVQNSEGTMRTSKKRLLKVKVLKDEIHALRSERDELQDTCNNLQLNNARERDAASRLARMPTWRRVRSRGSRGGGLKLEHQHRVAIIEQHANGTPPSAIGRNIVSVVKAAAPWLEPVEPTVREIRRIGFELTTVEECLGARKVASAYSVRLLGFDETTDLQEPFLTSNVQLEITEGAPLEDCILKAAYLSTKGGEAEAIVDEIEGKCFGRLRDLLRLWKRYHDQLFPDAEWSGPDPDRCSLHRLAGGGAVQGDTCNAARKAKRLMRDLIQKQATSYLREQMGDEVWDALSEEEREGELRVHVLDCHQHMRNIVLSHMSRKQSEHVRQELAHHLQAFASWERMTTDYDQILRAVYKEFHQGGRYYKGKGADFSSWMQENYGDAFFLHIERAEGGRQVRSRV